MLKKRQRIIQMLFFSGLVLLVVTVAGAVLLYTRTFSRSKLEANIGEEKLLPSAMPLYYADAWNVALGDVDSDGDLDFFIANSTGIGSAVLNTGMGYIDSGQVPSSTVVVEVEYPTRMETGRSDSIRVSLVRVTDEDFAPQVELEGHMSVAATPFPGVLPDIPVDAPVSYGVELSSRAYVADHEYEAFATANMVAVAFDVAPLTTGYQSLKQSRVTWEWNLIPTKPGSQVINLSIEGHWEPTESSVQPIQYQVWRSPLIIMVEQPWVRTDQISIMSLFTTLLGSALSAPWLYERVKDAREKRRKKEESRPKILLP